MFWNYFVGFAIAPITLFFYMLVTPVVSGRSDENIESCINPNTTTQRICSGRGDCISGMCDCYHLRRGSLIFNNSSRKYSGRYCQCDDYSCSYYNDQLCGGHGRCDCGMCMCDEGYTGEACECPLSQATCLTSEGKICNGVGECECGMCRCDPDSSYKGPTCEKCPTCPGKCTENKNCALCVAFMTGPYTPEECRTKCGHVEITDVIDDEEVIAKDNMFACQFMDAEDDCRFYFTYAYLENTAIVVQVQKTKGGPMNNYESMRNGTGMQVCPKSSKDGQFGYGGGCSRKVSSLLVVALMANFVTFIHRLK